MKTYYLLLFLLPFTVITGCSKDDENDADKTPQGSLTAYVKFAISGPITNGDFEYKVTDDNDFKTQGLIGYNDESLMQPIAALFTVYKSFTESLFMLNFPPKTGDHSLPFYDNSMEESYEIEFIFSREETYVGKAVEVKLSALDYKQLQIKNCKGTFSGEFNLEDQTGQNLGTHHITGEFELKQ